MKRLAIVVGVVLVALIITRLTFVQLQLQREAAQHFQEEHEKTEAIRKRLRDLTARIPELQKTVSATRVATVDSQCAGRPGTPLGYTFQGGTNDENDFMARGVGCVPASPRATAGVFCCSDLNATANAATK